MSIALTINQLTTDGLLVPYKKTVVRPDHPNGPRYLWLTPETWKWCFPIDDHPDRRIGNKSLAHLGDQMNAFVRGEYMDYRDGIDIKRLMPDGKDVWELKSYLHKPQLRVFGFFPLPKWFVATNFAVRDDLEKEDHGPKWDAAIALTEKKRAGLISPLTFFDDDRGKYLENPK
jgi:hypothetical protein